MTGPVVLSLEEGAEARGMMLISALHHAAGDLAGIRLRARRPDNGDVAIAVEALRWETGLGIEFSDGPDRTRLQGARLFAAIAFRTTDHLPLADARALGVPTLIALQFPDPERHGTAEFALERAAHDPRCFAEALLRALGLPR